MTIIKMKKLILILILLLLSLTSKSQILDTACANIVGTVQTNVCITYPLIPPVLSGQTVEKCFNFKSSTPDINLGYILLNSTCGPFAPYNYLDFKLFTSGCDTSITQGQVIPFNVNTFVTGLDTSQTYILCVTWTALCNQFSICPLIYESQLPIELNYFRASTTKDYILLEWETYSETNNSYFTIDKADLSFKFETLSKIEGSGNSTYSIKYYYKDLNPYNGLNYYKLNQFDYDGKETNFNPIVIYFDYSKEDNPFIFYNVIGQKLK